MFHGEIPRDRREIDINLPKCESKNDNVLNLVQRNLRPNMPSNKLATHIELDKIIKT